ncbi:MAG: L-idonate 5-dehydrogenase [Rhizobiales bacterium]|nr:L-idonate 5-dehydrogenase [Hyphomicrobiales bacterium]
MSLAAPKETRAAVLHAPHDLRVERRTLPALGPGDVAIRIEAGGICGSDLHYYLHGGFGAVRLKQPMVLGHELAGTILAVGPDAGAAAVGQKVAVNPSLPCHACRFCLDGRPQQCLDMRFFGSAMRWPHVQGGFADVIVCRAEQAVPVPDHVSLAEAAFAEPLAVCLHAVGRAGALLGRRVLVTGAGPIGLLLVIAARRAGAGEIVVTDIRDAPLAKALEVGADRACNLAADPAALEPYAAEKGQFDVAFEASGSGAAILAALPVLRPLGVLVQVGHGGDVALPISAVVGKEIELRGSFRFHPEFATAVRFIAEGLVDVRPLLTAVLPLERAVEAFDLAADKDRSVKVQLSFG